MKTKKYRYGTTTCVGYLKPVGTGYEVGFKFGSKPIFVGNFIKSTEANQWWSTMNREIRSFASRYKVTPKFSKTRYAQFLGSHLNAKYYAYVDRQLGKHVRTWKRAATKELTQFKRWSRTSSAAPRERRPYLKAA